MEKEQTVGRIGEQIFIKLLRDNNIDFIDKIDEKHVGFDFKLDGLNIEIKTSTIHNGRVNFIWFNNNTNLIDYIIGIVIDNNNVNYYIFDNEFICLRTGVGFNINRKNNELSKHKSISKNKLLKILTCV